MGFDFSAFRHFTRFFLEKRVDKLTLKNSLIFAMNVLDKQICLSLNRNWQPINVISVKQALTSLCSESNGVKPAMALDIEMATDENGQQVLVYANPVGWDEWLTLPVRPGDLFVQSARKKIRVPTVIVSANYDKIPMKTSKLTKEAILRRDNFTCQYSGEKLSRQMLNLDHIIPRDKGGKDDWENLVACRVDINSRKGNKLNHEAGLALIRKPQAPKPTPFLVDEVKHDTWKPFVVSK